MRMQCSLDLNGTWVPVAACVAGRALEVAQLRVAQLIIESQHYRIVDRTDHVVDCGALQLNAAALPCALDIIGLEGLADTEAFPSTLTVRTGDVEFAATLRIDTPKEQEYYRHGGILPYVLRVLRGRD